MPLIAPSPTTPRGDLVVQPSYFTSSVYVHALRADISTLILKYHEAFQKDTHAPFALFKKVWTDEGWPYLHFKVFDNRTRKTFLEVTTRLFLERTTKVEAPFTRAVALFGMYLFHYTQPQGEAPPIYRVDHIPIPYDWFASLIALPDALVEQHLIPLQPHARYIVGRMTQDNVFHILPRSELYPMNPRELPRELVGEDTRIGEKRRGRPSKKTKGKEARAALEALEQWAQKEDDAGALASAIEEYGSVRGEMLGEMERTTAHVQGQVGRLA